ncbi:MAG: hypothetical protein GY928_30470 [Colwellia sp.]|nr:hypothetical protein [Colwellia sp.]
MKSIPEIQRERGISWEKRYGQKLRKKLVAGDFGEEGVDWEERRHTSPRYYVGQAAEDRIIEYATQMGWLNTA